jgi:hypothetical protein
MAGNFKDLWKNRKQILEGITNSIIRDEFVEHVSSDRMIICDVCPNKDVEGKECLVHGTQPCCSLCGCSLAFKTRSLSSECPDGKWKALMTEEDEDKLDNLKD